VLDDLLCIGDDSRSPCLFSRLPSDDDNFTNLFSVPSPNQSSLRSRVFVTHTGKDDASGKWECSKDPMHNCTHITTARHLLQKLVQEDPLAKDQSVNEDALFDYHSEFIQLPLLNKLIKLSSASCPARFWRGACSVLQDNSSAGMGILAERSKDTTPTTIPKCPRRYPYRRACVMPLCEPS